MFSPKSRVATQMVGHARPYCPSDGASFASQESLLAHLHNDEEKSRGTDHLSQPRKSKARFACILLLCSLAAIGAIDFISQYVKWINNSRNVQCHCGVTAAEGLAQNCVFDELELGWMHPSCVDQSLTEEFSRSGPGVDGAWYYETEIGGEMVPVNITTLSMLVEPGRVVRFTYEQHITHCIFEWRKQLRQRFIGTRMLLTERMEDHIKHCGKMFLLKANSSEIRTKLVYPSHIVG